MKYTVATLLLFLLMTSAHAGFDFMGYKQGMSEKGINEHAKNSGHEIAKDQNLGLKILSRGRWIGSLLLCRDRLVNAFYSGHGGFMKFLKAAQSFSTNQGLKIYNADTRIQMSYDGKEYGTLNLYLKGRDPTFYVELSLFGLENQDVSNYQVTFRDRYFQKCDP